MASCRRGAHSPEGFAITGSYRLSIHRLFALCLSDSLRRELVVGEGCGIERAVQDADEELGLAPAAIEAERELVEVELQVLGADTVERPPEQGLPVPEDGVRPRQQMDGLDGRARPCADDGRSRGPAA